MRRTRSRRNRGRKRLPMVIGALAASGVAVYLGVVCSRQYFVAWGINREIGCIEERVRALRLDQQRLRRDSALLRTPPGMEREARRLGFLRPGETRLVIPR